MDIGRGNWDCDPDQTKENSIKIIGPLKGCFPWAELMGETFPLSEPVGSKEMSGETGVTLR